MHIPNMSIGSLFVFFGVKNKLLVSTDIGVPLDATFYLDHCSKTILKLELH